MFTFFLPQLFQPTLKTKNRTETITLISGKFLPLDAATGTIETENHKKNLHQQNQNHDAEHRIAVTWRGHRNKQYSIQFISTCTHARVLIWETSSTAPPSFLFHWWVQLHHHHHKNTLHHDLPHWERLNIVLFWRFNFSTGSTSCRGKECLKSNCTENSCSAKCSYGETIMPMQVTSWGWKMWKKDGWT